MDTTTKIDTPMLEKEPLVTILMLTYNRAHFIEPAIRGVITQTYQNWQLVVIDDGSNDDTELIINKFNDRRIKYIKHDHNKGLHVRRHESISYATSTYTAILDSDDIWIDDNKIQSQVTFLENNQDYAVVGTQVKLIDENESEIGLVKYCLSDEKIRNRILFRNQFTHSAIMIRTNLLKKTKGYQPLLAEDLELILQLSQFGKLANLPFYMTAHRVHADSMNDHGEKMLGSVWKILLLHRKNHSFVLLALLVNRLKLILSYIKKIIARR